MARRCNAGMNKIMQRDTAGFFRFAALQSTPGKKLLVRCVAEAPAVECQAGRFTSCVCVWGGGGFALCVL